MMFWNNAHHPTKSLVLCVSATTLKNKDEREAKHLKIHISHYWNTASLFHNQSTASLQHQNDEVAYVVSQRIKWKTEMLYRRKKCLFEI